MMGMMWIWPLFMVVVGVLCVAGLVWVVASRGGARASGVTPSGEAPLEILQRRYAGGEINKDQFDEMRRTLQKS